MWQLDLYIVRELEENKDNDNDNHKNDNSWWQLC